jgi:hypothetical protein
MTVDSRDRHPALRAAVLAGHSEGEPFAETHRSHQVVHGSPAPVQAQKFPLATSFNAAFSTSDWLRHR